MRIIPLIMSCLLGMYVYAQDVPTVFQMGENESLYSEIATTHPTMLLTACNNDMDKAYIKWTGVLQQIEEKAQLSGLDINGVKMWINFFWAPDGTIDYITFFPKPNSKNIDYEAVKELLLDIKEELAIDLSKSEVSTGVAHYGSAAFPTFHQYHRAQGN